MSFHLAADSPLLRAFGALPDPRSSRNQVYLLTDILGVALMGVICFGNDWVSIARWAEAHKGWFLSVNLCLNGIPSHDTLSRFFRMLDPKAFGGAFIHWTQLIAEKVQGVVALDGKTLRNSGDFIRGIKPLHLVSAFWSDNHLVLGQLATSAKSNEITAIRELLNMLLIKGATITIDAIGCQKDIAALIIEKEGNYVLGLKGNQGKLYAEAENFFSQAFLAPEDSGCDVAETVDKNRGRVETRQVWVTSDLEWLGLREEWRGLRALVCVRSKRFVRGEESEETRFYASSLSDGAKHHGEVIRSHWGIENQLHWQLDVTFDEDKCKVRAKNGPENFSLLKRVGLNVIRADKTRSGGVREKRQYASWMPDYRLQLFGVK